MRISEITAKKPKSPEQLRIDALKKRADQAVIAANAEVQRKRLNKATKRIARLRSIP